ncbi:MAG: hypothetical protein HKN62_09645 [Phycisphaerales bacterium]|nr:hypothetical protein [Phycisphaerales bacterium]
MTVALPGPEGALTMRALASPPPAGYPLSRAPGETPRSFATHLSAASTTAATARADEGRKAAESLVASTFVVPVLAMLRETSQAAEPFAPGAAERRFGPLLDQQLADRIVSGANFGLVDRVQEHLSGAGRVAPDTSGLLIGRAIHADA